MNHGGHVTSRGRTELRLRLPAGSEQWQMASGDRNISLYGGFCFSLFQCRAVKSLFRRLSLMWTRGFSPEQWPSGSQEPSVC